MSPPLFSVIVPTYGRPAFLAEAVGSVLAQTCSDFELLVVDDGGGGVPDLPSDPRVRVIRRTSNGGAAAARNTGIAEARGEMVTFLDDDDVYLENRLSQAAAARGRAAVLIGWRGRLGDPDLRPVAPRHLEGDVSGTILDAPIPHLGTCSVERSAVVRFDESFRVSEDVEWWLRQAAVAAVATVPAVGYLLRDHGGARQTSRLRDRLGCRLALLDRHRDYFAAHPAAAAYHWKRAGGLALLVGDRPQARRAFRRSFRSRPDWRVAANLVRASLPIGAGHSGAAPAGPRP